MTTSLKAAAWVVGMARLANHSWALLRCYRYTEEWTPLNSAPRMRTAALAALGTLIAAAFIYLTGLAFNEVAFMKAAIIMQVPFEALFTAGSLASSPFTIWRLVDAALESYMFLILVTYSMAAGDERTTTALNIRRCSGKV